MADNATRSEYRGDGDDDEMIAAYRHDAHKMTGQPHASAPKTFAGVFVNKTVPHGADGDASALSRPRGQPERTMENHETNYRLSLIEGESQYNPDGFARGGIENAVRGLLTEDDPEAMHRAWLESDVAAAFNESLYYPYTSLKYHTLLVAALFDNYRDNYEFGDLLLVVDPPEEVVAHRTIYTDDRFSLRIDGDADGRPSSRLGSRPWRSWASTWNRLTEHPLNVTHNKYEMVFDANLRRIGAWSTALQYIGDFQEAFDQ